MKLNINNEELNFKMTNQTVFNIDERFENYGEVINGLMEGKKLYNNALKLFVCCCTTRELKIEEVVKNLTTEQIHIKLVDWALDLYFDYRGINKIIEDKKKEDIEDSENSKKKLQQKK